jgi:hypothetical protein
MRFGLFIPHVHLLTKEETGLIEDKIEISYQAWQKEIFSTVIPGSFIGKALRDTSKCLIPVHFDNGLCGFLDSEFKLQFPLPSNPSYVVISKKLKAASGVEFNWRRSSEIYELKSSDFFLKNVYSEDTEFPIAKIFPATSTSPAKVVNLEFPWLTTSWRRSRRNALLESPLSIFNVFEIRFPKTVIPLMIEWAEEEIHIGNLKDDLFVFKYYLTHFMKGRDIVLLFSFYADVSSSINFRIGWGTNENWDVPGELTFPASSSERLYPRTLSHYLVQFILPPERKLEPRPWKIAFSKDKNLKIQIFNLRLFI